ncbi:MAG: hypothetical protein NT120_00815 [Candidatus Aenigmarchaeota archaeon]|nr:hypothetical protein [Candidatus Aenigmarchaeota archaeon]
MTNRHVKTINGRKYYYESIRMGKKVTSKYLGPVERIRKKKITALDGQVVEQPVQQAEESAEPVKDDENYIG